MHEKSVRNTSSYKFGLMAEVVRAARTELVYRQSLRIAYKSLEDKINIVYIGCRLESQ